MSFLLVIWYRLCNCWMGRLLFKAPQSTCICYILAIYSNSCSHFFSSVRCFQTDFFPYCIISGQFLVGWERNPACKNVCACMFLLQNRWTKKASIAALANPASRRKRPLKRIWRLSGFFFFQRIRCLLQMWQNWESISLLCSISCWYPETLLLYDQYISFIDLPYVCSVTCWSLTSCAGHIGHLIRSRRVQSTEW